MPFAGFQISKFSGGGNAPQTPLEILAPNGARIISQHDLLFGTSFATATMATTTIVTTATTT